MDVKSDDVEFEARAFLEKRLNSELQEYISKHNGGSIRHAGLRVIDVMEILHDFRKDAERAVQEAYELGKFKKRKVSYDKGGVRLPLRGKRG